MKRSLLALAALLAANADSSAQERTTALPPVAVDAPRREAHPAKPRPMIQGSRRAVRQASAPTVHRTGANNETIVPARPSTGSASEKTVSGVDVNARPLSRPAEALEVAPGLIVTQHSGEGKANQDFLRGVNLDHGTDLAISIDGMPVNMRTHGHGQGYADTNFLIPELIGSVDVRKGPYFADEGDFASVGAIHVSLLDGVARTMASITSGSFGYNRAFGVTSAKAGEGTLLVAAEASRYNGPWDNPDDLRKLNGIARYSQGDADNGFSVTAMAYGNRWNSTDQVPLRAITSGAIGRYGALDPSDGGGAERFSLSGRWRRTEADGVSKLDVYVIKSKLDLWNNFTFFLSDPVNGDQFHQHDDRVLGGFNAAHKFNYEWGGLRSETEIGLQGRYDDIDVSLGNTVQRTDLAMTRSDKVREASLGVYAQHTTFWTEWLRTTLGWRGDVYNATVDSLLTPVNSGTNNAFIGSPKAGLVLGPFARTELFLNAGEGFHSNDARGVTIRESPTDGTPVDSSPFLVRTKGAEIGLRSKLVPGLTSAVAVFMLDSASEILFVGDAGDTEPSRPSRRVGFEWTNDYRPYPWLAFEADLAMTRARFRGDDSAQAAAYAELAGYPAAQIGNAPGNLIPGAPNMVAAAGIRLGEAKGWFGALRYRYFGPRSLTEDGAFVSPATGILNGQLGYRFDSGWRLQLDAFNLLDSRSDQITYAYGSLLKTDALFAMCFPAAGAPTAPTAVCQTGVMDRVLHPVEPLALRVTLAGQF
ncbi:MAG: TonB-dependent receptor [Tardiphaga sp.]